MKKNKGGAPSITKKKQDKDLQSLGLFNRDSSVYLTIESELEALPPAKAFDLFCHYCARRDKIDGYTLAKDIPERLERLENIVEQRKNMLLPHMQGLFTPLKELAQLSEHTFVTYMDLLYRDYTVSHNSNDLVTNNFSFNITATFSWGYISPYYEEIQREVIYEHIFNEHLQQSEELREIYEDSSDKVSLKSLHTLLILNNQRISVADVTDNNNCPYYLEDRTVLESNMKVDRYKDVEYAVSELPPKNSAKAMSYQPNAIIHLNMDKPIDYIQEMLFALKDDWVENNSYLVENTSTLPKKDKAYDLGELRQKVMRFHKLQKTLPGKLTDLLYIYDNKLFGFTTPWISDQIYSYSQKKIPKGKHGDAMSSSTFSDYHKLK